MSLNWTWLVVLRCLNNNQWVFIFTCQFAATTKYHTRGWIVLCFVFRAHFLLEFWIVQINILIWGDDSFKWDSHSFDIYPTLSTRGKVEYRGILELCLTWSHSALFIGFHSLGCASPVLCLLLQGTNPNLKVKLSQNHLVSHAFKTKPWALSCGCFGKVQEPFGKTWIAFQFCIKAGECGLILGFLTRFSNISTDWKAYPGEIHGTSKRGKDSHPPSITVATRR